MIPCPPSDSYPPDSLIIIVPAGAESRAVKRAVKNRPTAPRLLEIPAGPQAVEAWLHNWREPQLFQHQQVLVVGLAGGLSPDLPVGDGVLIERCFEASSCQGYECDRAFTQHLSQQLDLSTGTGVTCDRVITTVAEKRRLGDRYQADIVDMESAVFLKALPTATIAILRVISDDCDYDLPDIGDAIRPDGTVNPLILTTGFLRNPIAALKFIRNSLRGLKSLEHLTRNIVEADKWPP